MPDSFLGLFRFRFMAGRPARHEAAKFFAPAIDDAQVDVGEANDPISEHGFGDADRFADERLAEKDELAAPSDLAVAADAADGVVGVVPGLVDRAGIGPRRGPVAAGRRHLAERFVWTVIVEVVAEAVEAGLLVGERGGGRVRGLGLERAMHALMPAILLGCAGLDALQADAELDPMHREPGQAAGTGARREGRAVVAADGARQTELAEGLIDDRPHRIDGFRHDAAVDQEAAVGIGEGQGIAARAIAGAEPALEIDAPKIVRPADRQERLGQRHPRPTPAPRPAQSFAAQQVADRRWRRPRSLRVPALQYRAQLLRTPIRSLVPQRHDRL